MIRARSCSHAAPQGRKVLAQAQKVAASPESRQALATGREAGDRGRRKATARPENREWLKKAAAEPPQAEPLSRTR